MAAQSDTELARLRDFVANSWLRVRDVFATWDEDGSGSIDQNEWQRALNALLRINAADASRLFEVKDA